MNPGEGIHLRHMVPDGQGFVALYDGDTHIADVKVEYALVLAQRLYRGWDYPPTNDVLVVRFKKELHEFIWGPVPPCST